MSEKKKRRETKINYNEKECKDTKKAKQRRK